MAKTARHDPHRPTGFVKVDMPPSAALSGLLHGTGTANEKQVHRLAAAADPAHAGDRHVFLPAGQVAPVIEDLTGLLEQAQAGNHPGADALAAVLEQLRGPGAQAEHTGGY